MTDKQIAHYRIRRQLGEGGMGTVFEATDERLERRVAVKLIRTSVDNEDLRRRFWREARATARVNHPNVCQIHEVGEDAGALYIVMELLSGEPLQERIARSPFNVSEALDVTVQILSALETLHAHGIVHRDLKPSNVFLTPHGVKLLDFGLAKMRRGTTAEDLELTQPGVVVGSPRYMAPEIWKGRDASPQSDLFSLGAILYEMTTGTCAFPGNTIEEVCHAVVNERPATLAGDASAMALDRVIQTALAKSLDERYASAEVMKRDIETLRSGVDSSAVVPPRKLTRIMVLPFRVLRPDPETDFLSFSLPDAVTASLSGLQSIVVCSSASAARFAGADPDLAKIAQDTGASAVLTGTLMRAGDQVRVMTQLVHTADGTVVSSRTAQVALGDLFQLQDDLAREIVRSLSIPLSSDSSGALQTDVPAVPEAYEFYLRANQLSNSRRHLENARELYRRALDLDPNYAPAWARLARVYRVLAKYEQEGTPDEAPQLAVRNRGLAEEAFEKAFALNPDLSLAHNLFTYFEVEERAAARESMLRLLQRVRSHPADPHVYSGLVLACRFCGLLDASVAADQRARQLDPGILTSVQYTYWMMGDYERAIRYDDDDIRYITMYTTSFVDSAEDAVRSLNSSHWDTVPGLEHEMMVATRAALEKDRAECRRATLRMLGSQFHDPEGLFFMARNAAYVGETDLALEMLERVVRGGFMCHETMRWDAWLAPLHGRERFEACMQDAEQQHKEAAAAFRDAGGERLLGLSSAPA